MLCEISITSDSAALIRNLIFGILMYFNGNEHAVFSFVACRSRESSDLKEIKNHISSDLKRLAAVWYEKKSNKKIDQIPAS